MRIFLQFTIILLVLFVGEFLHSFFEIPIPGNILGMVLLFILLCLKIVKLDYIKDVSNFFLKHLPFFFLPACVSIMNADEEILAKAPLLIILCVLLTILNIGITGRITQFFIQLFSKKKSKE